MRLNYIKTHNFFNHRDTEFNFDEVASPMLIVGQNGAGKSTFFVESVTYAIFGETRIEGPDNCILHDEDEMYVEVGFELTGRDIVIRRSKRRGKTQKLQLTIDGTEVSELLTETQQRIDRLFSLSYNSFISSIILKQEDADFFVTTKPDERKKIISEILDLGYYERMEKIAKEQRATEKAEIKALEASLNAIEVHDIAELQTHLKTAEKALKKQEKLIAEVDAAIEEANEQNAAIKAQVDAYAEIVSHNAKTDGTIANLTAQTQKKSLELKKIDEFLREYEDPTEEIKEYEDNIATLREERTKINVVIENVAAELTELDDAGHQKASFIQGNINQKQEKIASVKGERRSVEASLFKFEKLGDQCHTCLQDIESEHKSELMYALKVELDEIDATIEFLQKELSVLEEEAKELSDARAKSVKDYRERLKELRTSLNTYEGGIEQCNYELRQAEKRQREYTVMKERRDSLAEGIAQQVFMIESLREQIREVPEKPDDSGLIDLKPFRAEQARIREEINELMKAQGQLAHMIEATKKAEMDRARLKGDLVVKRRRLNLLEKLCVAYSRNGIPATIIATVLPEIQDTANAFLNKMSQGMLEIAFRTIETTKSGDERETLEIDVFDGIKWRPFESFSGGERFRVSLAIRLALSKVLTSRAGIDLELLILDEPASALDPQGRNSFIETLNTLSDTFSRIIVMTHLQDITDEFNSKVYIGKTENGSKITY